MVDPHERVHSENEKSMSIIFTKVPFSHGTSEELSSPSINTQVYYESPKIKMRETEKKQP